MPIAPNGGFMRSSLEEKLEEVNKLLALIIEKENIIHNCQRTINSLKEEINVITEGEDSLSWLMQNEPSEKPQDASK